MFDVGTVIVVNRSNGNRFDVGTVIVVNRSNGNRFDVGTHAPRPLCFQGGANDLRQFLKSA